MNTLRPFHLAIPVNNLTEARSFYGNIMGFQEGRSSDRWVDFNCFGHQLVIHLSDRATQKIHNSVDHHGVPVPHFGVILEWSEWECLVKRLEEKDVEFVIEPYVRFQGKIGEQATMFFTDPSGNALEFKAFKDDKQIFASENVLN